MGGPSGAATTPREHIVNTPHTRKKLMAGAVSALAVAAAAAVAAPGSPSSPLAVSHTPSVAASSATPALAALVTPNSLYAATGGPAVAVLGPNGSLALPDGYFIAPVTTGQADVSRAEVSNPSLSFAPTTLSRSTPSPGRDGGATTPTSSGPTAFAAADGPMSFGLFSPTGAFLGLIGPGGLLIGDGVLPGQDGGILIGNGADGGEGQDGGDGGIFYGNGGNGGGGGSQKPGGNGGNSGFFFSNGGDGGNGAD